MMGGMTISHIIFDHGKLLEPAVEVEIWQMTLLKHRLLENPPFIDDVPTCSHHFFDGTFRCHV